MLIIFNTGGYKIASFLLPLLLSHTFILLWTFILSVSLGVYTPLVIIYLVLLALSLWGIVCSEHLSSQICLFAICHKISKSLAVPHVVLLQWSKNLYCLAIFLSCSLALFCQGCLSIVTSIWARHFLFSIPWHSLWAECRMVYPFPRNYLENFLPRLSPPPN